MTTTKPHSPGEKAVLKLLFRTVVRFHVWVYRMTGGRLMNKMGEVPILLLTTRGRKSGLARTVALAYLRDGARYVLVASQGGLPTHPQWYLNLKANPEVEIQVGADRMIAHASTAASEERARLWPRLVDLYSDYATYQERTTREIPVVILHPLSP